MQVKKRNGKLEEFNIEKIAKAIYKTRLEANQDKNLQDCIKEAKKISKTFEGQEIVDIETIQDAIEDYFIKQKEIALFKMFAFYREKRRQDRIAPWIDNDERQDLILQKYLLPNESKKEFLDRISLGNEKLLKIFRKKEAIWGGRILYAIGREGNITASNCFIKGTKVLTDSGYKNIEEINVGDKVLTHDNTYQLVNATMKNFHNDKLIELDSLYFNSPIVTTPNHKFLTQEGWIEAQKLSVHKRTNKTSPHFIKFKKLDLTEEQEYTLDVKNELNHIVSEYFILEDTGDGKYQPKVKMVNKGTPCFTSASMTPINKTIIFDKNLAYVMGMFAGDGSITARKNTKHNLSSIWQIVGNERDSDILNRCADIIEEKFGLKVHRGYSKGNQKTYIIRVDSIVVSEFFNKYVGKGSRNKFIHNLLKDYPSFLFGIFDSDGSINSQCIGSITLNNRELINTLKEMSDKFGIPSYISTKINSVKKYGNYPSLIFPKNSLCLFIKNVNKKYDDDRIKNCVSTNAGTVRIINDEAYIQLSNKETIDGNVDVYNISVENNHNYVVGNVLVHNCYVIGDPEDNLEDIYKADYEMAKTYAFGGGCGLNLSKLRPKGAKVNNTSGTTPGIMVFAEKYSHTTLNVQQDRRRK